MYLLVLLLCLGSIIAGNIHWKNKLSAQGTIQTNNLETTEQVIETLESKPEVVVPADLEVEPTKQENDKELTTAIQNLPKDIQTKLLTASSIKKPLHLIIYGSASTSEADQAWPKLLAKQLAETYGNDVIKVTIISEDDHTSIDIIRSKSFEKVAKLKPDIVLFEPFTLNDNTAKISMKNRFDSIDRMINSWKNSNENVSILLQPPNPFYNATYYPDQVNHVKEYATENKITFVDHWGNWPDLTDKKMTEFLTEESRPNDQGNKVWADYLIHYFTSK